MKEKICDGHRTSGRWIFASVDDVTTPHPGRIVYGPRWWLVTDANEVLFFDTYGSPQCNSSQAICERLGAGFGAPPTHAVFLHRTFLPHRCSDYV